MPTIEINGKNYGFDESQVIDFNEGLVGLPEMRQAALIALPDFEPFCWLASITDERNRFVVVDPAELFEDYRPAGDAADVRTLAIVKISSDWRKTTVNLRAPIFVEPTTRRGVQRVLNDTDYSLTEAIPQD